MPLVAPNRILDEIVQTSLVLAKGVAPAGEDLDALVREAKRIRRGEGLTPENAQAFSLFYRAALAGHCEAQREVGYCFGFGGGVRCDFTESSRWFRRAAEQGDGEAQWMFGMCCQNGNGIPKDATEAAKWYRRGAEQGETAAQDILADCYFSGKGVHRDYCEAYAWLQLCADGLEADTRSSGAELTREQAAAVASAMSPSQFARASQLYEEYKRKYSAKR